MFLTPNMMLQTPIVSHSHPTHQRKKTRSIAFYPRDGLILTENCIQKSGNSHIGATGQIAGRKTLVVDWITLLLAIKAEKQ